MISRIDHLVLTVRNLEQTCRFYQKVLGFTRVDISGRPVALHFGTSKFNIHEVGHEFEPKALQPTSGSADICLVTEMDIEEVQRRIESCGVVIELGPVDRDGASGAIKSIYFRDPDANLIEVSEYY